MKQTICLIIVLSFTILIQPDFVNGQPANSYVDSIIHQCVLIDSLISSFSQNPDVKLIHWIKHYESINGSFGDANFYKDATGKNNLKLSYLDNCKGILTIKVYYFINNEIVSIQIVAKNKKISVDSQKYFLHNELIFSSASFATKKKQQKNDKDLKYGYQLLSDFEN